MVRFNGELCTQGNAPRVARPGVRSDPPLGETGRIDRKDPRQGRGCGQRGTADCNDQSSAAARQRRQLHDAQDQPRQSTFSGGGASGQYDGVARPRKKQLLQRLGSLRQQKDEAERRFALQGQRLALARAEVERAESIASRGFLPLRELDNRRATALAVEQASSELSSQILGYEREISEAQVRLAAIPGDMEAATADARGAAALIDQQRTVTESQSRYVVTAAVAGRIVALPFVPGQTIAAGSAVAVTSASNEPLEAELYAPTRAAGFLEEGQTVQLMYQAYPHQKFGTGRGRIVSVSRTVLAPDELAIPGLQLQELVFRLRVALDDTAVAAYGRKVALRPGMLLTADVVIDRRSLMEWLLDPLYASGRREASSPS